MNMKNIIKKSITLFKRRELIPIIKPIDKEKILLDKIALITGGSSGIGLEIAKTFLDSGCKVIIAGTNKEKLEKCINKINNNNLKYIVLNVLDVNNIEKKIITAESLFEENRIDILVNSAGIVSTNDFFNTSEEEYDKIMNINTKGTFFMSKYVSQRMINKKIKGHILNISSSSALRPAWTPYHMSKWAIKGFTLGLADILIKHGIVVNAIAPGPTATPMLGKNENDTIYNPSNPSKRLTTSTEIANLAVFMVSDMGNMIVGDTFYITGGSGTITYHH